MATNRIGNRQERSRQVRSATPVAPRRGGLSRRSLFRCCLAGVMAGMLSTAGHAGTVLVPGPAGDVPVSVTSFQNQRFSAVFQQEYDFSCGSAALASLLSFHYGDEVSEQEVFQGMWTLADQDKVRQQGFSMLDRWSQT